MADDKPYFMQAAKFVAEVEFDGILHREIATALRAAHEAGHADGDAVGYARVNSELLALAADMAIDISVRRNVQPKSLRAFREKHPDAFQAALDRASDNSGAEKSNV